MNRTELESKHIAELHTLAAEAGVSGYRMLRREELIEKLADGGGKPEKRAERQPRQGRERQPREKRDRQPRRREGGSRKSAAAEAKERKAAEPQPEPARPAPPAAAPPRPRRKRRRFGRRRKDVGPADLLLPPPGRQALVYGESRAACTALLREFAAELSAASQGPDPIALLVDPSPEELADWRREAPDAEIVAASKARHASDALAQAARRAAGGEDVVLLVDSLSRLEDAGTAREIFDGGLDIASTAGSLTVVAALERSQ